MSGGQTPTRTRSGMMLDAADEFAIRVGCHFDEAHRAVMETLASRRAEIAGRAAARYIVAGSVEYEGSIWQKDRARLDNDLIEELADAIVYMAVLIAIRQQLGIREQ